MHFQDSGVIADSPADVLVVGSVNVDTGFELDRIPGPGETIESRSIRQTGGGKGANQALAARQVGGNVALLAAIGASAEVGVTDLAQAGVDLSSVITIPGVPTGQAVLLVTPTDNAIITLAGANAHLTGQHVRHYAESRPLPRVVAVQYEVPQDVVETVVDVFAGRAVVIVNPSPFRPTSFMVFEQADILVINEVELGQLLGSPIGSTDEELERAVLTITGRDLVVTLGGRGALVRSAGALTWIPAMPVDAVDTVGAGDAFLGTLATRLASDDDLVTAARFACAAAALAVTVRGARNPMLTRDAVLAHLSPVPIS